MFLMATILLFGLGSLNITLSEDFDVEAAKYPDPLAAGHSRDRDHRDFCRSKIRNWLFGLIRKVRDFVVPLLQSPAADGSRSAATGSELIGSLTQFTVLIAFGQDVNYFDVVLVSITVSLFAGLMPVPGGIGVTEAALTAGFISIGVPPEIAFAAALTCRMITFYIPPVIGVFVFRWMQKQRYL